MALFESNLYGRLTLCVFWVFVLLSVEKQKTSDLHQIPII